MPRNYRDCHDGVTLASVTTTRLAIALFIAILAPGCDEIATSPPPPPALPPSTLYITDYGANAIFRYRGDGEFLGVFAAGAEQRVDRPARVRLGPRGALYAAGFGRGDVVRYDAESGAMRDVFFWDTTLLEEPVDLVFAGSELVVLGNDTRNAVVIDAGGAAMREFGAPTMRGAQAFLLAGGELFVATESHPELGSAIQVWDLASGALVRHFGGYGDLAYPTGLALGPDGLLYVSDFERDRVLRFDPATGESRGIFLDSVASPTELAFGPDGALYVLDAIGLHRFDAATGAYGALVASVGDGHLERPLSFLFVTDEALREAR